MNNTQLPSLCEGSPSFIKYMQNWCRNGVPSFNVVFYEANLALPKKRPNGETSLNFS